MTPTNTQDLNAPTNVPMRDVVLLHGWGINRGVWQSLLPYFPSTWRIHTLDLPGYAGSNPLTGNRIEDWISHLLQQAPERAVWVGWSLGATLALRAALEFPDRIDKLCLISPTPRFMKSVGWNCGMDQTSLDELWAFFQTHYETGLKRFLMLQTHDRALIRSLNQSIAQYPSPDPTALANSLEILTTTDLRNQLHLLQMPLQVVLGNQDQIVSPLASKLLAAHLQDGDALPGTNQAGSPSNRVTLLELEGGHLCFLEQQEKFVQRLVAFVETYDKRQIAHQFSRAAPSYDSFSQLQREMADRLIDQISVKNGNDIFVLIDLGCGTGESLERIGYRFPDSDATLTSQGQSSPSSRHLSSSDSDHQHKSGRSAFKRIGIDIAAGMIEQADRRLGAEQDVELLVADLEQTGLESGIADLVFCNAALQWCDSMTAFTEIFRLLKPGGKLLAATFGPETLVELKQAWLRVVDTNPPVHQFASADQIESALKNVGFELTTVTSERVLLNYPSARELLFSLKGLGATHANMDRRRGLWGKESFFKLCDQLQQQLTGQQGIEVTFELLYLEGTRPS